MYKTSNCEVSGNMTNFMKTILVKRGKRNTRLSKRKKINEEPKGVKEGSKIFRNYKEKLERKCHKSCEVRQLLKQR